LRRLATRGALALLLALIAVATASAGPHSPALACQTSHTCPAGNHQYAWHGLVCATPQAALAGIDTTTIVALGDRFLCHSTTVDPWHRNIAATTFWVGEIADANLADGSQVCSTYDDNWAYHWSGVNDGRVPANAPGCPGSIVGGCDGVLDAQGLCQTEPRVAVNGYFPTEVTPLQNPFYLDIPFDDINDPTGFAERCRVIPWAYQPGFAGHCADQSFSYLKNHWVQIVGPNGHTCFGQVEDAGPSHGDLYHDAAYVFGTTNARPIQGHFNDAGMDVSPALNGCLGFKELNGDDDRISWRFVDAARLPAGPWLRIVTSSQVDNGSH
jgi:hypothetical protein